MESIVMHTAQQPDTGPFAWPRLAASCAAALAVCLHGAASAPAGAAPKVPYRVVTTVGMVTDIVQQVAGERASVQGLLGPGVDPHLYKPTRDDVALLMRADVIFYNGLMLEGKMSDTLVKVARNKPVYAVTELIDEDLLLQPEDFGGHYDPHVWMDASLWSRCVDAVARALSTFDPSGAVLYRKNADQLMARCLELHEYGRKAVGTVPARSRVLISSHDAFNYFGRAYGIEVQGVQGISTESEAGLQRINALVEYIVTRDVKAVFVESSVPRKSIEALVEGARARGRDVRIGGELYSDAMGAAGAYEGTYLGMLDHNLTTVARALGGEAPAAGWQGLLGTKGAPTERPAVLTQP
jgi:manganese/zinc/iron transport system substrate-binding protein